MYFADGSLSTNIFKHSRTYSILLCGIMVASCSATKPVDIASVPTPEAASLHRVSLAAVDKNVSSKPKKSLELAHVPANISKETKFSSKQFGVAGSPRVTYSRNVRKGGGRYQIGKPYTIRGKRYYPKLDPNLKQKGLASWYGPNFHGRLTANGEVYDQYALSAAHPTMPLPSYARVTNLENGSSLIVRVNDRGPFSKNRVIDLSARAAQLLGYTKQGVAKVKVEYAGKAPLHGLDEQMLVASYNPGSVDPSTIPNIPGLPGSNTAVAQNEAQPVIVNDVVNQTTSVGYAPQEDAIAVPRPEGLINSYLDNPTKKKSQSAFDLVLKNIQFKAPNTGMNDLVQLEFGPFLSNNELAIAEKVLSGSGILQPVRLNSGQGYILTLVTAREDTDHVLKDAVSAKISIYSKK